MAKVVAKYRLTCSGNTRPVKDTLKARKWTYDPASQTWYMLLVEAHADRIRSGDGEFLKGLGGQLKGCRLCLDGIEVWRSKTYTDQVQHGGQQTRPADPDGYGWNSDAAGNPAATRRIPGSSPDDMI